MSKQIVLIASIVLSLVTCFYGVVFSYQLAGNFLIGTALSVMMLGFNMLEFSTVYFIALFIVDRVVVPIFFGVFIVVCGVLFSVFSNIWVISNSYDTYKTQRNVQSDRYKSWEMEVSRLTEEIREISALPLPSKASILKEKSDLGQSISAMFDSVAYNSNGRSTGKTVGEITGKCTVGNYYSRKYCSAIVSKISEFDDLVEKESILDKKARLLLDREKSYQNAPVSVKAHAPGVVSITTLVGVSADNLMAIINLLFALCNEIGAIFGWYAVGYGSRTNAGFSRSFDSRPSKGEIAMTKLQKKAEVTPELVKSSGVQEVSVISSNVDLGGKMVRLYESLGFSACSAFAKHVGVPVASLNDNIKSRRPPSLLTLVKIRACWVDSFDIDDFLVGVSGTGMGWKADSKKGLLIKPDVFYLRGAISENLGKVLKESKLSIVGFSEIIGYPPATVTGYLKGNRMPPAAFLVSVKLFCKAELGVDMDIEVFLTKGFRI